MEAEQNLRFYNPDKNSTMIVCVAGDRFTFIIEPQGEKGDGQVTFPAGSRNSVAEFLAGYARRNGFEPVENPKLK